MTVKDRRIHLLLQIFFVLIGLYQFIKLTVSLQSGQFSSNLLEFQQGNLPAIDLTAAVIAGVCALISSISLWQRTPWAYGFTLFSSGLIFTFHLMMLEDALQHNSYEVIPIFLVLIFILQSFPYLIRRSHSSL